MNKSTKSQLKELHPQVKFDEPLSQHSTFHIGGPADAFVEIKNFTETPPYQNLKDLITFCKTNSLPYRIIGGGSNILFHDKGFRGLIIKLTANTTTITKNRLTAEAGTPLALAIIKAEKQGFPNLTPLKGIPGTVGGAVRGNAGARGMEIKQALLEAEIFNPKTNRITTATPASLQLSYRSSKLKTDGRIVLKAHFRLSKRKPALAADPISWRLQNQPGGHSAGSFFKNPAQPANADHPFSAGYLIDQCGLKGHQLGQAKISDKHANFFQNIGTQKSPATQKDVLALAKLAKKRVQSKFKITLEEEVQIIPQK